MENQTPKKSWLKDEILKMYSSQDSFFSKKRVESGIAFLVAQIGMLTYLIMRIKTMDIYSLIMWAGTEFSVAGYIISQIQKEKTNTDSSSVISTTPVTNNETTNNTVAAVNTPPAEETPDTPEAC